jgi:energy-coupling factor transporter ATP-binding protein EcfA2
MFLRSLHVQNLRSLQDVKLVFDGPDGIRKWTLILGENGCGKSTVLRAAALVLAGSEALPSLLGETESWIRYGAPEARISATIETAEGERRDISLSLVRGEGISAVFDRNRESLSLLDRAVAHASRSYLTVGYGASRRLNSNPESAFSRRSEWKPRARAVATLFSPDAVLDPLEAWVIDADYRRDKGGRKIIQTIAKDLLPDVDFHGIDKKRKQLLFKTRDGITPLSQLSDGYQNVAA